jgi:hypothetical protein
MGADDHIRLRGCENTLPPSSWIIDLRWQSNQSMLRVASVETWNTSTLFLLLLG